MTTSGFQLSIEIPQVICGLCRSRTYTPPGIWDGSWKENEIPPTLQLRRQITKYPPPVFHFVGCATEKETEQSALQNGWTEVQLRGARMLICPECQALISELIKLREPQK